MRAQQAEYLEHFDPQPGRGAVRLTWATYFVTLARSKISMNSILWKIKSAVQ